MANTLADVEKRLNSAKPVSEIEGVSKKSGWKFWLFIPVALVTTIAGCAFFVVRRIRHV
jgi:hypothetical protein